jgi:hypothetical protein
MLPEEFTDVAGGKLLAASEYLLDSVEAVWVLINEQVEERCCDPDRVNAIRLHERPQGVRHKVVFLHDHDGATRGELPPQLEGVHVPRRGGCLRRDVPRPESGQPTWPEEPGDGLVRRDDALRAARGSGGEEDHGGGPSGLCCLVGRLVKASGREHGKVLARQRADRAAVRHFPVVTDDGDRVDLAEDLRKTLVGPPVVEVGVGGPALQHGQLGDDQAGRARADDRDDLPCPDAQGGEPGGITCRGGVE